MDGFEGGFSLQGSAVRKSSSHENPAVKSVMRMNNNSPNNQQLVLPSRLGSINNNQRLNNQLKQSRGPETNHPPQSEEMKSSLSVQDRRMNTLQMNQKPQPSNGAPVTMSRAKVWTVEVENAYRFQLAGFQNESEYLSKYPRPGI